VPESRIGKEDGEGDLTGLTVLTPEGYDDVKGPENLHSIRDVFKSLHYYRGTTSALKTFREDPSDQRFEYLCRAACREARLDPDRWEEYSGAILGEVGRHAVASPPREEG
jgi:hypothetical protein